MKVFGIIYLVLAGALFGSFHEIQTEAELKSILQTEKECLFAVGAPYCIPCERVKKLLVQKEDSSCKIYWIDLKKIPSARHIFNFKAIPYFEVFKEGQAPIHLSGEKGCRTYLMNQ